MYNLGFVKTEHVKVFYYSCKARKSIKLSLSHLKLCYMLWFEPQFKPRSIRAKSAVFTLI